MRDGTESAQASSDDEWVKQWRRNVLRLSQVSDPVERQIGLDDALEELVLQYLSDVETVVFHVTSKRLSTNDRELVSELIENFRSAVAPWRGESGEKMRRVG